MKKWLIALGVLALVLVAAFTLSPWPGVLVIRAIFDKGAADASQKLQALVPADTTIQAAIHYDPNDKDAFLDLIRPAGPANELPTIVWVHGGGFVSGRRSDITNYLTILAGRGMVVANVDYSIAPEATYPKPVAQLNQALRYLTEHAAELKVDASRLIIAGDSAGAQIAAQMANIVTSSEYSRMVDIGPGIDRQQLKGVILFCGPFDLDLMRGEGIGGWFTFLTAWAYSGTRNFREDAVFQKMSVAKYVTPAFPPAFISAGNADPLAPHSVTLAEALRGKMVRIETLFFPPEHNPPLGHEYQFDLTTPAGREAIDRAVAFIRLAAQN